MRILIEINTDQESYKDVKNLIDIVEIALEQVNEVNKTGQVEFANPKATIKLTVEHNEKSLSVLHP